MVPRDIKEVCWGLRKGFTGKQLRVERRGEELDAYRITPEFCDISTPVYHH